MRFLGYGLSGGLLISGLEDWGMISFNRPNSTKNNIDKIALTAAIKSDIYKVFKQEMWIISKDYKSMAQGNTDLEQDLKDLYASFASEKTTQKKLDAFCKKWKLEKITI